MGKCRKGSEKAQKAKVRDETRKSTGCNRLRREKQIT